MDILVVIVVGIAVLACGVGGLATGAWLVDRAARDRIRRAEEAAAGALAHAREVEARLGLAEQALAHEQKLGRERVRLLEASQGRLTAEFKALSSEALRESSTSLLSLAEERFATVQSNANRELDARRLAVEHLVAPLGDSLSKMESRLQTMELGRQDAYSALVTQVRALHEGHERLRVETGNLVTALRSPSARGRWGEIQLRRVVEMAGMLHHCDFTEQAGLEGADGRLRPDIVVHLPGDKTVVIDAKAPLEAYLDAVSATDDATARTKLVAHARQLRVHVDKLAAKSYWEALSNAPDFVVLFLPSDQLLSGALEHDAGLMEYAVGNRVLLATPVTLIALLRSVAYGWQQQGLAENARRIAELGREMQDRLARFAEHLAKVGRGLESAVDAYNASVGSFESRVLVTGRRFQDLEVAGRPVPELTTIDLRPRPVASREEGKPTLEPVRSVDSLPAGDAEASAAAG